MDVRYSAKDLLISLYVTQLIALTVSVVLIWLTPVNLGQLLQFNMKPEHFFAAAILALAVVAVDLYLSRVLNAEMLDDGGINALIFRRRSVPHIVLIAFIVAVSEELLFRGILQSLLGIWGTTIIFTLIHVRYLKKWVLLINLIAVSMGLGWLMAWSGQLSAVILAHFLLDMILGLLIRYQLLPTASDTGEIANN